jgi:hypothetical protein
VIGEQEWAYWMKPDIKLGNLLPEEFKQLIVEGAKRHLGGIKERVEFVKPGQEVVTGITAVEAFGHTPGMLAFNISSGSRATSILRTPCIISPSALCIRSGMSDSITTRNWLSLAHNMSGVFSK